MEGGAGTVTESRRTFWDKGFRPSHPSTPHSLCFPRVFPSRAGQGGRWRAQSHEPCSQGTVKIKLTFFPFPLYCKHIECCRTNSISPLAFPPLVSRAWASRAGLKKGGETGLTPPSPTLPSKALVPQSWSQGPAQTRPRKAYHPSLC